MARAVFGISEFFTLTYGGGLVFRLLNVFIAFDFVPDCIVSSNLLHHVCSNQNSRNFTFPLSTSIVSFYKLQIICGRNGIDNTLLLLLTILKTRDSLNVIASPCCGEKNEQNKHVYLPFDVLFPLNIPHHFPSCFRGDTAMHETLYAFKFLIVTQFNLSFTMRHRHQI